MEPSAPGQRSGALRLEGGWWFATPLAALILLVLPWQAAYAERLPGEEVISSRSQRRVQLSRWTDEKGRLWMVKRAPNQAKELHAYELISRYVPSSALEVSWGLSKRADALVVEWAEDPTWGKRTVEKALDQGAIKPATDMMRTVLAILKEWRSIPGWHGLEADQPNRLCQWVQSEMEPQLQEG